MGMQNEKRLIGPIPMDLVVEIASRLPAKAVVRFRCVSKQWCSITSTPDFIKTFSIHASARPSLMCVLEEAFTRERIYMSFPYHQDPQNRLTRVEKFNIKWLSGLGIWVVDSELDHDPPAPTVTTTYRILNSTNGLMLFEYGLYSFYHIIWNPTLRQHVVLPESNIFPPVVSFIGYDPIDQKYKVLSMSGHSDYGTHAAENLKVFTLGAQEKWRKIEIHPRLYEHIRATRGNMVSRHINVRGGICINGVLYYYLVERDFIVSFDVRAETFAKIIKPEGVCDVDIRDVTCAMINYKGKLAWICTRTSRLWVLEDAQKQEWSLRPLDGQIKNSSKHYFCGVTREHEAIFMPKKKKQPFCAFYYHLESKRTRQVAYQGINQKRSYYLPHWRGSMKKMFEYDYYPDMIENLMPLNNLSFARSVPSFRK